MHNQKIVVLLISFLLISELSRSQVSSKKFEVAAQYHYGFVWSHRNSIEVLVKGYTKALELSFYKRFDGANDWELKYKYPSLGGSFMYFDFANPEQMGYGYAFMAFYDFPLVGSEKHSLNFKIGIGPGFVSKYFHRQDNFKNYGLSTTVNGFAYLGLKGRFQLFEQVSAHAGLNLSHFSNASFKKPNLGINIPTVTAGLAYSFKDVELKPRKTKSEYSFDKSWNHDIVFSYGMKEKNPIGGDLYSIYSLNYNVNRHVSFKSRVGIGPDIFYNTSMEGEPSIDGGTITDPKDIMQIGVSLAYFLQVSKFSIFFAPGYYLHQKHDTDGNIYSRMGARYLVKDHIIFNLSMKTHFAVADHVEYGIGYRF